MKSRRRVADLVELICMFRLSAAQPTPQSLVAEHKDSLCLLLNLQLSVAWSDILTRLVVDAACLLGHGLGVGLALECVAFPPGCQASSQCGWWLGSAREQVSVSVGRGRRRPF